MRFELKTLDKEAIPAAIAKAERYRLLNEPHEAQSICLDILAADPAHEQALITLLLSLTDQFDKKRATVQEARNILPRLASDYERAYYGGIICERWAKAQQAGMPGHVTYHWIRDALAHYERAELIAPEGNQDAVLRWNACVRLLEEHPELQPKDEGDDIFFDEPPG